MCIEDFKKIKEVLEIQDKYVSVSQISKDGIINASKSITSGEVRDQQNTYEVVKQCEILIEKAVSYLTKKGITLDQLMISSNMVFFCRLDYINELKKYYQENDEIDKIPDALMQKLHIKVFPEIVPVSFRINTNFIETKNCDMISFDDETKYLPLEHVSGIVNWKQFVYEMNSLGYNINFFNYENGLSFFDYTMAVKQNCCDTKINVTTDSGKIKKYTLPKI